MVMQDDPGFTLSHGHTQSTPTYRAIPPKELQAV